MPITALRFCERGVNFRGTTDFDDIARDPMQFDQLRLALRAVRVPSPGPERLSAAEKACDNPAITLSVPGAEGASPINSGDSTPTLDATHRR